MLYIRPSQLAERYQVTRATIYKWTKQHNFPKALKIGTSTMYSLVEVEAWESTKKHHQ